MGRCVSTGFDPTRHVRTQETVENFRQGPHTDEVAAAIQRATHPHPDGEERMHQRRPPMSEAPRSLDELRVHHQELKERLHSLEKLRSLSPEEQFEARVIKKRKLAIKDAIRAMEESEA